MTPIPPIPEDLKDEYENSCELLTNFHACRKHREMTSDEKFQAGVALFDKTNIERIAKLTAEVENLRRRAGEGK